VKIELNDLVSVTDASNMGVSKLVSAAMEGREFVVLKNNKPAAAIVGIDKLERLQRVEEIEEDIKLLALAVVRTVTDTGKRVSLDDAAAQFGIDLDDLDEESDDE
jgi:prevent-host-death family protein